ncbi:DUF6077 domain-containing protein [Roseisalinus antarcticus]|uniref:Glycosyltransferase RgtA/B/C/D-like domain-containing protein n=1 Tax=Roseisalinus antarcticus TaxID=254357 RepID=A0A1Y5U042_9RHOB|nr:DUF6077 domain-containing protein [Roseisalinus antarcticus]SLN77838.1 hypothetical protein ROA7023_04531 [Roseisalinus antarcticus]
MISTRVFFSGFLFLLAWTIGVHLVTFQALSFGTLYLVAGVALIAGVLGALKAGPIVDIFTTNALAVQGLTWAPPPAAADRNRFLALLAAGAVVFLVTAGLQYKFSRAEPFWIACLGVTAFALWYSRRSGAYAPLVLTHEDAEPGSRRLDLAFAATAASVLLFYFLTSVPDADDSLFLNLAVGAKELRDAVYTEDTMLGIAGLDFIKSTYRLESYQLLTALISDATGLPVILVAHAVVPGFVCVWAASVLTLLHGALFPRFFGWTLGFHLALLVAMDGALQSFGYHAIPRFFQGKGPYVTVMVPLLAVLTVSAMKTGSWRALSLLVGAVVISIGFTANAVYAAPLAVALVGAAWLVVGNKQRWRAFRLPLVILYPAFLALNLLINDPPGPSEHTAAGTIGGMLWGIFGSPQVMVLGMAVVFAALAAPILCKRFWPISVYLALALILVLNPLLLPLYAEHVTGYINHRLFWAVPIPFLIAAMLGLFWAVGRMPVRIAVLTVLMAGVLGPGSILYKAELGFSALKVPYAQFRIAQRISGTDIGLLLAPESVSAWVTVLEDRPPVVEGRWLYIPQREDDNFRNELDQRASIYVFLNRDPNVFTSDSEFISMISRVGVQAIMLDLTNEQHDGLRPALIEAGYEIAWQDGQYALLLR